MNTIIEVSVSQITYRNLYSQFSYFTNERIVSSRHQRIGNLDLLAVRTIVTSRVKFRTVQFFSMHAYTRTRACERET